MEELKKSLKAIAWIIVLLVVLILALPYMGIKAENIESAKTYIVWALIFACACLALAGGVSLIISVIKYIKEAGKDVYNWGLPVLAAFSAVVIDMCDKYLKHLEVFRIIIGVLVAMVFLAGGIVWKKRLENAKPFYTKLGSIFILLIPPIFICVMYFQVSDNKICSFPPDLYLPLGFYIFLSILALFLSKYSIEKKEISNTH